MPSNQPDLSSTANVSSYYDIVGKQTDITVQGDVNEINISNQHSNVHEALISGLRGDLNPSDFDGDGCPECLEDTRKGTLQSIYQWVDASTYPNVLLLVGEAGIGKSTIATTVAGEYQKSGQLGCQIFFQRGRSHPGNVIQTITYSLAVYNESIAESLVEKLKKSGDIGSSNLRRKFEILLRDPLSIVATKVGHPVLIVMDALDECGTPELRQSLLEVLRDRLPSLPANLRILITSRPGADIDSLISKPSFQTMTLDQSSEESKVDVAAYIKHQFDRMKSSGELNVPDDCEWDNSLRTLADSADGQFIWASTAVRFVREERLSRYGCFQKLVTNAISPKLDELYMTIFSRVSKWNEEDTKTLRNIFSLILFAKHPLSDSEINGILDVEMDVTSNLLSYFHSLVRYERGQPITIYHTSFYDYLISCEGKPWYVDPEVQRTYIASRCFERMGDFLKYNICSIPSDFVLNTDVPDIDDRITRRIPPFLKYICCNRARHLLDISYSPEQCSQLRCFVYNQLLFWFEVLSLTNTFNDHVKPALLFTIEWVGNNDRKLSSFLKNAYRQATTYSGAISASVLQIYASLLPLTQGESPMSIHYVQYAKSAFRVEYLGRKQHIVSIKTIIVERDYVKTISFSPDGTRILTGSSQSICVRDATSGELIARPMLAEDDKSNLLSAAYLPDGRYIIVASKNGVIRKWDGRTNCLVWKRVMSDFQLDSTWHMSVAFSPDRKSFVFGDRQGRIWVWNVDTGEKDSGPLEGHTECINCLSFSPDGKYLASGSNDGTITIFEMDKRGMRVRPFRRHARSVTTIEFSPTGTNLVSGSSDGTILVFNASTGEMLREIKCESGVLSVTYSPNELFILGGGRGWMSMWNVADDAAAPKVFQVDRDIEQVSFSSDGSHFVSVNGEHEFFLDDGLIEIWNASWSVEETKPAPEEQGVITSISLSPGGKFIASASGVGLHNGSIYLWNVFTGGFVKKLKLGSRVISVAFSPVNEQHIAFGSWDGTVQFWDVTNDDPVTIGDHMESVLSVAFSPLDGNHVASGSCDNTIRIWKVEGGESVVGPLIGHKHSVCTVTYSPDGTRLVSGSTDKTIRIWNSETGDLLSILNGHSDSVNSVAYSFDGSRIVSGSEDKTILVWDAQSDRIVCGPITRHKGSVKSVCFSLDGKQVLSGSSDNTVRVWDAITDQPLFPPFNDHAHTISSIILFPDGRHFATEDGTIRIWTFDTIPNGTNWEIRDNWVISENGKLMMWIPKHLHEYLYRPRNVRILGRSFRIKLHLVTE